MQVIQYDMSSFTSRTEAQTMLDVLHDKAMACEKYLKEKPHSEYISGA